MKECQWMKLNQVKTIKEHHFMEYGTQSNTP